MNVIVLVCKNCKAEIEYHRLPNYMLINKEFKFTLRCPFCDYYLGQIRAEDVEEEENEINNLLYGVKNG